MENRLAKQLWALGDAVRLQIISLLPSEANCERGNNVSQLADKLGLAQPTVSHHLRILRQAGLVANKRMCRDVYYWINEEEVSAVQDALSQLLENRPARKLDEKNEPDCKKEVQETKN